MWKSWTSRSGLCRAKAGTGRRSSRRAKATAGRISNECGQAETCGSFHRSARTPAALLSPRQGRAGRASRPTWLGRVHAGLSGGVGRSGLCKSVAQRGDPGIFDRLVKDYFESPDYLRLGPSTQKAYRGVIERMVRDENIGHRLVKEMSRHGEASGIGFPNLPGRFGKEDEKSNEFSEDLAKWRPVGESNPCFQRERLTS